MRRLAISLFLGFYLPVAAQTYYNDAQLWAALYIEKSLNDRFRLHFKHQSRITQNISWYNRFYIAGGVSYRAARWLRIRTDYAFVEKRRPDDAFAVRHQLRGSLIFKHVIRRWRFIYRNMSQLRFNDPFTTAAGYVPRYFNRNKLVIKYEATKRFTFYVYEEVFVPVYNQRIRTPDRIRSGIGTAVNVTQNQELRVYFMLQNQLQKTDWYEGDSDAADRLTNRYVYGVTYSVFF